MTVTRFLLVDDDPAFQSVFLDDLKKALPGAEVVLDCATSMEDALSAMRTGPYSMAFVGYRLGTANGIELVRRCALEGLRTPLILLSGSDQPSAEAEALAYGAFDFLNKDGLSPRALARALRNAWNAASRREELRSALRQVQESSAAKSLFLSNMSHELRTPLNGVLGFAEMLQQDFICQDPEKVKDYAENIAISGRRLMDLIVELLTLRRVKDDRFLTPRCVDGKSFFRELCQLHVTQTKARDIDFSLSLPERDFAMTVDVETLRLALRPILNNAVKFTDVGGKVFVTVTPGEAEILTVEIRDEGIGMDAATLEMAKQAFYQQDTSFSRRFEGAGIGLTVADNSISLLGGTFSIESEQGKGTTVVVRLPVLRAEGSCTGNEKGVPEKDVNRLVG